MSGGIEKNYKIPVRITGLLTGEIHSKKQEC
jgi:hypothetical protein